MSRYRESGFGGYVLLTLLSGLLMIILSFFLAVAAAIMLGWLDLSFGEIFDINKILSQNAWLVLLLWFVLWLLGMYIVYVALWRGRSFR